MSTENYRVGAAIFNGPRLVSVGWNSKKTHPGMDSRYNWQHAETSALIGTSKLCLVRCVIYVVRLTKGGNLGISKPCKLCQRMLADVGIKKIRYVNREGKIERL